MRLVLSFRVVLEHFLKKVYITITDIVGEKKISLAYPIGNLDSSKEVTVVSMFSDNVQYQIREPLKVLLIKNVEKLLPKRVFKDEKLIMSIERKLITTPLDANDKIFKTDKLACITEMVLSLDELNNTYNLEDGRLSNILLRYHVTGSEEFTSFELVTPQYKIFKNRDFTSLTLRIIDQKNNGITDGPGMTIVLHIR